MIYVCTGVCLGVSGVCVCVCMSDGCVCVCVTLCDSVCGWYMCAQPQVCVSFV